LLEIVRILGVKQLASSIPTV